MTAFIYFGEILVASLLAIVLLAISPFRLSSDATLFAAGIVAWTFAEYVVHRFVLHGLLPTQHGRHHASPDAAVLIIFWQIWACFALIYLIAGGAFLAGGLVLLSQKVAFWELGILDNFGRFVFRHEELRWITQ
jgi:surface polysaccharide O-acyltransferase-like enzyme